MTDKINQTSEVKFNSATSQGIKEDQWCDLAQLVCDFAKACKWAGGRILSAPLNMGSWLVEKVGVCFSRDLGIGATTPAPTNTLSDDDDWGDGDTSNHREVHEEVNSLPQGNANNKTAAWPLEGYETVESSDSEALLEDEQANMLSNDDDWGDGDTSNHREVHEEVNSLPQGNANNKTAAWPPEGYETVESSDSEALLEDEQDESVKKDIVKQKTTFLVDSKKQVSLSSEGLTNPKPQEIPLEKRLKKFTETCSPSGKQTINRFVEVIKNGSDEDTTLIDKICLSENQGIPGVVSLLVLRKVQEAIDEDKRYVFIPIYDLSEKLTTVFELDIKSASLTQCNLTEQHDLADKFRGELQKNLMKMKNKEGNFHYLGQIQVENSQQSSHPKKPSFMDRLGFLK